MFDAENGTVSFIHSSTSIPSIQGSLRPQRTSASQAVCAIWTFTINGDSHQPNNSLVFVMNLPLVMNQINLMAMSSSHGLRGSTNGIKFWGHPLDGSLDFMRAKILKKNPRDPGNSWQFQDKLKIRNWKVQNNLTHTQVAKMS